MNEFNQTTYANDFFWFSYFGFTSEDVERKGKKFVIEKCANRAYLDLNRTLDIGKETERAKAVRKQTAKELADKIQEQILSGYQKENFDYDTVHFELCKAICSKEIPFTFGQAQKWVNMTMKYLVIIQVITDIELIKMLHIPIDSYILQAAWEAEDINTAYEDKEIKFPIRADKQRKDGKSGAFTSEKVEAWSTWDFDDAKRDKCKKYYDFQESMKKYAGKGHGFPLQWEGRAWIEVAKRIKNNPD